MTQNKTAVFLAYGDSRMKYSEKPFTTPSHNVLAWQPSTGQIVVASEENIEGISYSPARSGFIIDFGKLYHEKTGENVLIVPAYQGGSGFQNNGWQAGGSLYTEALSRFNAAYEKAYNPYFAGCIGSIGSNNVATVDAVDKYTDFITRIRQDFHGGSPKTPFVVIELQEDYISTNGRLAMNRIIEDLPKRVKHTAVADNTGIQSNFDLVAGSTDKTHDYEVFKIAERCVAQLDNAIDNYAVGGSELEPLMFHSAVAISKEASNFRGRVTYPPMFHEPFPTNVKWKLIRADDVNRTNEVVVEEIAASYNQHVADFTAYGLPVPDGKYYFSCIEATNSHGTSMYITSPDNAYHHV